MSHSKFVGLNNGRSSFLVIIVVILIHLVQAQSTFIHPVLQDDKYGFVGGPGGGPEPAPNTYEVKTSLVESIEIIKARGFVGERYWVKSKDGHKLRLYHIINPLADPTKLYKYPVIVSHGLAGDSSQMLARSRKTRARKPTPGQLQFDPKTDDNTAFTLANNNFDVWMREARGVNENDHDESVDVNINKMKSFWNYSIDEQSQWDLPTEIDFVLEQTQTDKLHYIGYSESTFMILALLSYQPWYQDKLASVALMAPVAYDFHLTGTLAPVFSTLGHAPISMDTNASPQYIIDMYAPLFAMCTGKVMANTLCYKALGTIFGYGNLKEGVGDWIGTLLRPTTLRAFQHFGQLYVQQRFGMYDFGKQKNLIKYGQAVPPNYNLANIKFPRLILLRGGVDFLSRVEDQQRLLQELGTKPYLDLFYPHYDHLDFMMSATLLQDISMPIAKAFYQHLIQLNPNGDIYRNALKSRSPKFNPLARPAEALAIPDGKKVNLELTPLTMTHLIKAFFSPVDSKNDIKSWVSGDASKNSDRDKELTPLKFLENMGRQMDSVIGIGSLMMNSLMKQSN